MLFRSHTTIYKVGNQQGPTIQHRELCSYLVIISKGRESEKDNYETESLHCIPEMIPQLKIFFIAIKNFLLAYSCFTVLCES